jgi:hypothetical protein
MEMKIGELVKPVLFEYEKDDYIGREIGIIVEVKSISKDKVFQNVTVLWQNGKETNGAGFRLKKIDL